MRIFSYIKVFIKNLQRKKYFSSLVIILLFGIAVYIVLYIGSAPSVSQLGEGDVALRTVYAPFDFTYPTEIDREKSEEARAEIEAGVLPVYDIDPSIQDGAFAKIDAFFAAIEGVRGESEPDAKTRLEALRKKTSIQLADKDLQVFLKVENTARLEKIAKDALENIFLIGVLADKDKTSILNTQTKKIFLKNQRFKLEREIDLKEIIDEREAKRIVRDTLDRMLLRDKAAKDAVYSLIELAVVPNARFNELETLAKKEKALDEFHPIYKRETVKKNELIVDKGKRITKYDVAKLAQITSLRAITNRTSYLSGLLILLAALIFAGALYFILFDRKLIQNSSNVLLISLNAFLAISVSLAVISQTHLVPYVIPLASVGMLLVLLLGTSTAFITVLLLSIYIGFMAGGKLDISFVLFIGSVLGIYAVRGARKRSQIFFASFAVSIVNFLCLIGISFFNNIAKGLVLKFGTYGIANGIISGFIVIGLLPVYEYIFGRITNITLLELSDLSNPLLKELTIKAPGTYHHSILVGNLAEEASNAIGANSLLARVGAYYHDIGKKEKAEYFVENEKGTTSKHEKLTPSMSALIITNHTKDGVELAKKFKLNSAIVDFISQHHGTGLIYYFFQRALEKAKSEKDLKEEEFRYPGPKPQTKETAIVLLADSVEASSRMLSDPTPARIRSLVQKIINNKFIDGQLDECDLTLRDLNRISESFVRVLTGIFHARLEYPELKSRKEIKNAIKNKGKQSK